MGRLRGFQLLLRICYSRYLKSLLTSLVISCNVKYDRSWDVSKGVNYTRNYIKSRYVTNKNTGVPLLSIWLMLSLNSYLRRKSKQICIHVVWPGIHFFTVFLQSYLYSLACCYNLVKEKY